MNNPSNNAFVTGADRGLGLALSAALLDKGWRVFAGQFLPDWDELAELTTNYPNALTIVPLDVSSQTSAQQAAQTVGQYTDRIDLLINNAGVNDSIASRKNLRQQPDYDHMNRLYNINALAAARCGSLFASNGRQPVQKNLFCLLRGRQHFPLAPQRLVRLLHVQSRAQYGRAQPI